MDNLRRRDNLTGPAPCCGMPEATPPASALRNEPLHRFFKAVTQAFWQQGLRLMRTEGIDGLFPGAAPLLLHLGDEDGLALSELARRCDLESSTLTPIVDELERQGLAARARDPEDRRVVRLHLTETGRATAPRLRALLLGLQETALTGISDADLQTLHSVLERIAANLNQASHLAEE